MFFGKDFSIQNAECLTNDVVICLFCLRHARGKNENWKTDWMRTETPQMGKYSHDFFLFCRLSFTQRLFGFVVNCYFNFVAFFFVKFEENKVAWVAGLATIGAVEFMAAAVALFILRRLQVAKNYRLWRHSRWISLVTCYMTDVCDFTDKLTSTNSLPKTLTPARNWHGQRPTTLWIALNFWFIA